ncbi:MULTISPECIES: peptidylprolyl isomerase [unclassified Wenzhouxiangella]|uniref:peptidylprolyl isomerase n=1 Tax=unclassified Wenzhouxiangella TaxID=2613841 RepID=UPI001C6F18C9|nr:MULTISPECIES: peptidylprolyl isomerase [unclassified Wenzhouxiangella]
MRQIAILILLATCSLPAQAQNPHVWLDTDMGPIILELDEAAAPVTVENFLRYVDDGFYDGLVFHRIAEEFVIQGGGFDSNRQRRDPTYEPIVNEADNGLSNLPGTIAMARTSEPDSATSQFFINLEDNSDLDPDNESAGYAVFGEVVIGMETVEAIGALNAINAQGSALHQWPFNPPVIERAVRTDGFPLMADHSGSWFDPANDGVGFNVEIANRVGGEGPIALVYWYNFEEQRQFWLLGQSSFNWGDSEVTVDLLSNPGDEGGTGFQSPPESEFTNFGTLTLRFDDCANGTFSYDMPGYGTGDIDITRLSRPEGFDCRAE